MPLKELIVGKDLTYQEYPVKILDTSEKVTRNGATIQKKMLLGKKKTN
jgi:hypothetical protein